jgi:transcriptional regulator GlxA family with amidase domain
MDRENNIKHGAEIASICTGHFCWLLSGYYWMEKPVSTHWSAADDLRAMFPKINVQTDKLITDEKGIYTNGGAYSFLNLIIYLVENILTGKQPSFVPRSFKLKWIDKVNRLL